MPRASIDTSTLSGPAPRASAGVFAPGPLAGLQRAGKRARHLPVTAAFIKELDAIAKMAAERKDLGAKEVRSERAAFKALLCVIADLSIKSAHARLLHSIHTTARMTETDASDAYVAAAIHNIEAQAPKRRTHR